MRWRVGRWASVSVSQLAGALEMGIVGVGSDIPVGLSLYMSVIRIHSPEVGVRMRGFCVSSFALSCFPGQLVAFRLPSGCSSWRRERVSFSFFLPSGQVSWRGMRDGMSFSNQGDRSCTGASLQRPVGRWSGERKSQSWMDGRAEPIRVAARQAS